MERKSRREKWMSLLGLDSIPSSEREKRAFLNERRETYNLYYLLAENEVSYKISRLIEKDMVRTRIKADRKGTTDFLEEKGRREAVSRILLAYASTNKTVGYVQGMNWICSILYYVISNEKNEKSSKYDKSGEYAESITYFCFFTLMVDLGDLFSEKMDDSPSGINGQTEKVLEIIKSNSKSLFSYILQTELLSNSSFLLRWMLLLFSAEISLEETLFLWDRLFLERPKHRLLPFLCAAVLLSSKSHVLGKPIYTAVSYLQNPTIDIKSILKKAEKLLYYQK